MPVSKKDHVSCVVVLPKSLVDKIEDAANELGSNRAAILKTAVEKGFNFFVLNNVQLVKRNNARLEQYAKQMLEDKT